MRTMAESGCDIYLSQPFAGPCPERGRACGLKTTFWVAQQKLANAAPGSLRRVDGSAVPRQHGLSNLWPLR